MAQDILRLSSKCIIFIPSYVNTLAEGKTWPPTGPLFSYGMAHYSVVLVKRVKADFVRKMNMYFVLRPTQTKLGVKAYTN